VLNHVLARQQQPGVPRKPPTQPKDEWLDSRHYNEDQESDGNASHREHKRRIDEACDHPRAECSPCLDAGDPASSFSLEPVRNLNRVNCGAFGNTLEASKSGWSIYGDFTDDCVVNILDLIQIRNRLNASVTTGDNWRADVDKDGRINILDLIQVRNALNSRCK